MSQSSDLRYHAVTQTSMNRHFIELLSCDRVENLMGQACSLQFFGWLQRPWLTKT